MHVIGKEFSFCYGHRVWSQKLNSEYSLDDRCVCRHLHGHQGTVRVYLKGDELTDGMVTDFKHLNWLKKFIDDELDHKFIIDKDDPLYDVIIPDTPTMGCQCSAERPLLIDHGTHSTIKINPDWDENMKDLYEGFVVVNFVPTSENLCKWLHGIAQEKMSKLGVEVNRVQFLETPKSQANYYVD
jgi:6-pyruvoyltetrahydropterin/6-carboxytetrahydropterin synthase